MEKLITMYEQEDPIKGGKLSVRALNCCKVIGVTNMYELKDYVDLNGLWNIRNCGKKTIMELQNAIYNFAYVEEKERDMYDNNSIVYTAFPSLYDKEINEVYNDCIMHSNSEVVSFFQTCFPSIGSFYEKLFNNSSSIFIDDNNLKTEIILESWQLIIRILKETNEVLRAKKYKNNTVGFFELRLNKCILYVTEQFEVVKSSLLISRMPKTLLDVLNYEFNRIKDSLSTRARNILDREYISYSNICFFCFQKLENYKDVNYCGNKTAKEIIDAYSSFPLYIYNLNCSVSSEQKCLIVSSLFPFVKREYTKDISIFKDKYGYYPFFKILSVYFRTSNDRNDVIINKAKGLTQPVTPLFAIAEEYNLTKERVRQLVVNFRFNDSISKIFQLINSENYPFISDDIISPDIIYRDILEREFSTYDYFTIESLIGMLSLYKGLKVIDYEGRIFLVNKDIYDNFDFNLSLADISKTVSARTTENMSLPINFFITNYIVNQGVNIDRVRNIIIFILNNVVGIEVDKDYNIMLKQNAIDVESEFFKILESNGSPMHFNDLCKLLRERFPEVSYADGTLRSFLFNSERISAIGKASIYTINKWNISKLTIRALIREILEQSNNPLSLDEIVDFLALKGRKTTKNSINSTIISDEKCEYVKFKGGLIGLASKKYCSIYQLADKYLTSRKTFEDRLSDFVSFIDVNHHIPFSTSDENEASLCRWYKNILKGNIFLTNEQRQKFDSEMLERTEYIMTSSEFAFIEKCKDFKYYVSKELELPNTRSDMSLYSWFFKTRQNIHTLDGKKKHAWEELIDFLSEYGFIIK